MNSKDLLVASFKAALAAADPATIVPKHLPEPPKGRTLVVGAGKAGGAMARAVEDAWPADKPLSGVVITRYQHSVETKRIDVVEAGHPVPDEAGEASARRILAEAGELDPDDLLLCLMSGGGSALMTLPAPGLTPDDLQAVNKSLLKCGANIQEMNVVRKHLSASQGGRLAAVCKARIKALIISDVTGDDPTHIGSGPCAPDPSTYADALAIAARYEVDLAEAPRKHLESGLAGDIGETPKPGDPIFARVENNVISTSLDSLRAAETYLKSQGINAAVLGDSITGEASEAAKVFGGIARHVKANGNPWPTPVAILSGGETTVTVKGKGRGGRNAEFLLSLAFDLQGLEGVSALSCDTDGIDGMEDNAGALITPDTLERARAKGLKPLDHLDNNDAYTYFAGIGDLVMTGPTLTNVNDFRIILIE
ncbi:MAG: glycerate kinase [Rhodospirillales bacterium]|jgi:glycerate 2-kinase|nr:glycerate kinase [Rhodospirillales bacterium]